MKQYKKQKSIGSLTRDWLGVETTPIKKQKTPPPLNKRAQIHRNMQLQLDYNHWKIELQSAVEERQKDYIKVCEKQMKKALTTMTKEMIKARKW